MTYLEKLLEQVTPGEWIGHNMVHADGERQMTAEEIGEYVCNSVKMGDSTRFLFVSGKHADGGDCDICHTGNGPRGPANTALIAMAPELARKVIAAEKVVHEVRAMMNAYHSGKDIYGWADAVTEAIDAWEAAQ